MDSNKNGVRSCLIANPGNVLVSLDFNAQEVRLAAYLSNDPALLSCYVGESLRDVHSLVACEIAGQPYEEFIKRVKAGDEEANALRQAGKVTGFTILYAGTAKTIASRLHVAEAVAQGYIDSYFKTFPGVKDYQLQSELMATRHGWVPIHGGGRRHLSEMVNSSDRRVSKKAARQAANSRIQGAAATQVKFVLADYWNSDLYERGCEVRALIHDEVLIEVPQEHAAELILDFHKLMTRQFLPGIPSESSVGIGLNFGQLIELKVATPETINAAIQKLMETI